MGDLTRRIPVSQPWISHEDRKAIDECLKKGWLSGESPIVAEFEKNFAAVVGRKHGVAVTSGSMALDLAFHVLGLCAGDEVILPSFTIASCLFAVIRSGASPVFVDVESDTWNMSIDIVRAAVTERTKAVLVVHTYGLPVQMTGLIDFCNENSITVIEDAAEAHGVEYQGKPCGSFGFASIFSFYANKAITTGEGGMVVSDDDEYCDKLRYYRNLAFAPPPGRRFVHQDMGWNMRMSSLQAALGNSQLNRLQTIVERKRTIGLRYSNRLLTLERVRMQPTDTEYAQNKYWVVGIVLDEQISTDDIAVKLKFRGIESRPFFHPLHLQPLLRQFGLEDQAELPVSEMLGRQGLYIPSYVGLEDSTIDFVASELIELIENSER